jgi:lipoprotein-anchoring transpeptidase ErfK/SrfK
METYEQPRRKAKNSRARDRQLAREQRRRESAMAVPRSGYPPEADEAPKRRVRSRREAEILKSMKVWMSDAWWYATHRPDFIRIAGAAAVVLFLIFAASHVLSGRIFPNVWVMGIPVGDLTVDEAQLAIAQGWQQDVKIALYVEGEQKLEVSPSQLGLQIDSAAAASEARSIGMSGIPFGYNIEPAIAFDYQTAQAYLLEMTDSINTLPFNAGYEYRGGQVIGLVGRNGRELDVTATAEYLQDNIEEIVNQRRFDLTTLPISPDVLDPNPYLEDVKALVSQQFALVGYDPFTNVTVAWSTPTEQFVSWLEAGSTGLKVRQQAFKAFIEALNKNIAEEDALRFINFDEALAQVETAVAEKNTTIYLRFNHKPEQYEVVSGDTGYRIARKKGVPFYLVEQVNPGFDWDSLKPGDIVNLPPKDVTLPLPPVPNKRIVVDLDNQVLVAFENGQEVFRWSISSGIYDAPTSPGVFQVLSHSKIAYGSSSTLCNELGCGQWKMYWFMGMYEVLPGLMNGFHGWVELPDGRLLGDGNVGQPFTFGCVMSTNDNAEKLYNWAEIGTVVEVVSSEYAPQSDLARSVYGNTSA